MWSFAGGKDKLQKGSRQAILSSFKTQLAICCYGLCESSISTYLKKSIPVSNESLWWSRHDEFAEMGVMVQKKIGIIRFSKHPKTTSVRSGDKAPCL